jgi:hypothetical protein
VSLNKIYVEELHIRRCNG